MCCLWCCRLSNEYDGSCGGSCRGGCDYGGDVDIGVDGVACGGVEGWWYIGIDVCGVRRAGADVVNGGAIVLSLMLVMVAVML